LVPSQNVLSFSKLQSYIRKCVWLLRHAGSKFHSNRLLRQAEREFEADYRIFFKPGETKGRDVGRPILIRGTSCETGVLLIHGFMAAPRELSELADYLGKQGYWVYVARVKGHGTSADDLAGRSAAEWRNSVDTGIAALSGLCRRVIVGGFSFGGGLALDGTVRHQGCVSAVFAVCPPTKLQDLSSRFAPVIDTWNRLMDYLDFTNGKKEFVEIVPEHPEVNYNRLPVASLVTLEQFMVDLEARLPDITIPVLIVQSMDDPVVDQKGTRRLFDLLGTARKSYKTFEFNRHGILSGTGSELVHAAIGEFIEATRNSPEPSQVF